MGKEFLKTLTGNEAQSVPVVRGVDSLVVGTAPVADVVRGVDSLVGGRGCS
jgi:hypothetical protein